MRFLCHKRALRGGTKGRDIKRDHDALVLVNDFVTRCVCCECETRAKLLSSDGVSRGSFPYIKMYPKGNTNKGSSETMRAARTRKRARVLDDLSPSPSSLWDVIVKWDDICFKHIIPRLNSNDVKFLHGGEYGDEKVD